MEKQNWVFFDGYDEVRTENTGEKVFSTVGFHYITGNSEDTIPLDNSGVDMIVAMHNEGKSAMEIEEFIATSDLFTKENRKHFVQQAGANYYGKLAPEPKQPLTQFSTRNLYVIQNFLLYHFAPDEGKDNTLYDEMMLSAEAYVEEDHVDGEDSPEAIAEKKQMAERQHIFDAAKTVFTSENLLTEFHKEFGGGDTLAHIETLIRVGIIKPKAVKLLLKLAKSVE